MSEKRNHPSLPRSRFRVGNAFRVRTPSRGRLDLSSLRNRFAGNLVLDVVKLAHEEPVLAVITGYGVHRLVVDDGLGVQQVWLVESAGRLAGQMIDSGRVAQVHTSPFGHQGQESLLVTV